MVTSWIAAFFAATAVLPVMAQALDVDRLSQLYAANNLDNKGNTPFHLKMTFQLYDLAGKPSETGTVEEWWNAPLHRIRTVISSPSFSEDSSGANHDDFSSARESYLVYKLLNTAVRPIPKYEPKPEDLIENQKLDWGKVPLECLASRTETKRTAGSAKLVPWFTVCTQPKSDDVRLVFFTAGSEVVARNSTGKFHDTYVALDLQISYVGRYAITGKVTTLQAIDPAKAETEEPASAAAVSGSTPVMSAGSATRVQAGVISGKRIKFVQPEYPEMAKEQHMSGSVLLHAIIGEDGSVKNLVPIASSDPMFTSSAIASVRRWKYLPYLLNGEPTKVDTTITVDFAFNPG